MAAGHSGQFTPMRLPVNTVIHTTLVGLEPATFRSLVRRATSSATEPREHSPLSPAKVRAIDKFALSVDRVIYFVTRVHKNRWLMRMKYGKSFRNSVDVPFTFF